MYYGWAGVDVNEDGKRCGNGDGEAEGKREGQGEAKAKGNVWPMVMSIGWNPYYKNTKRSVVCPTLTSLYPFCLPSPSRQLPHPDLQEVHILHHFPHDFYGAHMNLLICGFIRPEYDYVSKESLIEDIRTDIEVARKSLERERYRELREETWLMEFKEVGEEAT